MAKFDQNPKQMNELAQKKVSELVSENINTAHVFKKHGIDFCCGGGVSIEKACEKNNIELNDVISDLNKVDEKVDKTHAYNDWNLDFLIDHILSTHHAYVRESLPLMVQYADKVASVHGHHYEEVINIKDFVHEVYNDLMPHLQKEEMVLFPYIKNMVRTKESGETFNSPPFGSIQNPINMMEVEHDRAGDIFKEIDRLSKNYNPPQEACNTFRALYALLQEFEQDLHQHIHLENNILFPKAISMESELLTTSME